MRITLLFTILFLFLSPAIMGQNKSKSKKSDKPLNYYAYKKMIRSHFNYTILGSQAPVSGFKVETNKPTMTLKGNVYSNTRPQDSVRKIGTLINLELTGGASDDIQEILSGNELNGYFKANIGVNLLFNYGTGVKYALDSVKDRFEWNVLRASTYANKEEVAKQLDTAFILLVITDAINGKPGSFSDAVDSVVKKAFEGIYTINNYSEPQSAAKWKRPIDRDRDSLKKYYRELFVEVMESYGADSASHNSMYNAFIKKIMNKERGLKYEQLLADSKRAKQFKKTRYKYQLIDEFEIKTYDHIWTKKSISWLNLSVSGQNSSFKLYDVSTNMLQDSSSFQPALSVTYNYFSKAIKSNKYFYLRTGITVKRANSLVDLSDFTYTKETIITVNPNESLKSEKTGTAYQGKLTHGLGLEIPVEIYWDPWKYQAIPGLYFKPMYSYGEPWINKNKLSIELGLNWNVTNSDEDAKNVLTILPYFGWSNLFKEYEEEQKINKKKLGDRFSVGVKFGVPINLGK